MKLEFILIYKRLKYEISNPAIKYILIINNRSTRTRCEYVQNKNSRAMTSFCSRITNTFLLKIDNRDSTITCEKCKDIIK